MHLHKILMLRRHSAYTFGITGSFEALKKKHQKFMPFSTTILTRPAPSYHKQRSAKASIHVGNADLSWSAAGKGGGLP